MRALHYRERDEARRAPLRPVVARSPFAGSRFVILSVGEGSLVILSVATKDPGHPERSEGFLVHPERSEGSCVIEQAHPT